MAGYPGMKPMLQFTSLPQPPKERRRRRRKPVRTPEVPKVKSIPFAQGGAVTDDQENVPRPCLKWVSPQFCDELTENGTHLKNHNPRRKKTNNKTHQPLQEVKELFPDNAQQCPKSATRRNPLTFKQSSNQHCFGQYEETHKLRSRSAGWCSQEISMYPSTCMPHSKLRSYDSESSDESLMDEGDDDERVRCNEHPDDGGCCVCPSLSANQNVHLGVCTHLDDVDDHTVPSVSQQDQLEDENFAGIQLTCRLSATTQFTETSNPSQRKQKQSEDVCDQPNLHTELLPNKVLDSHRTSACTRQSHCEQDKCSVHPKLLVGGSDPHTSMDRNNDGHTSYPSVENLGELIKDMSVGDATASNEHSIPTAPADTDNPNPSRHDQNMQLEHHQTECSHLPSYPCTSASCDHKLSRLEVTTFNPHLASTPFRDHHSPMSQMSSRQDHEHFMRSYTLPSAVRHGQARIDVTPGHLEEQEMSILVKETPEHLWNSPKLADEKKERAKGSSRESFQVSESIFHPACSNIIHKDLNESLPQQMSCRLSDIDMTTFNNFDHTDTSQTTMGDSQSNSTSVDTHRCMNLTIPPTQDSAHSSEGEWSILAKQTPNELWCSPVVKVVDNSF